MVGSVQWGELKFASVYGFRHIQNLVAQIKRGDCEYDYVSSSPLIFFRNEIYYTHALLLLSWSICVVIVVTEKQLINTSMEIRVPPPTPDTPFQTARFADRFIYFRGTK